jgi:hypothetical protein
MAMITAMATMPPAIESPAVVCHQGAPALRRRSSSGGGPGGGPGGG